MIRSSETARLCRLTVHEPSMGILMGSTDISVNISTLEVLVNIVLVLRVCRHHRIFDGVRTPDLESPTTQPRPDLGVT